MVLNSVEKKKKGKKGFLIIIFNPGFRSDLEQFICIKL